MATTERYSKVHNAKTRRDYFKAMYFIAEKPKQELESNGGYRNFFTKKKREKINLKTYPL